MSTPRFEERNSGTQNDKKYLVYEKKYVFLQIEIINQNHKNI